MRRIDIVAELLLEALASDKRRWITEGDPEREEYSLESVAKYASSEDLQRIDALEIGERCTIAGGFVVVRVA